MKPLKTIFGATCLVAIILSAFILLSPETRGSGIAVLPGDPNQGVAGRVFNVRVYGAIGNGTTDDSNAFMAAIAAAQVAGGGTVYIPAAKYLISGQIAIPNNGDPKQPRQKPMKFLGDGADKNCPNGNGIYGYSPASGTILDMRYAAGPKLLTMGASTLEISGINFVDANTDAQPFILTTNTTLAVHDCFFQGYPTNTGTACVQDGIVLGGTSYIYGSVADSFFQGYGTVIERNHFANIRTGVLLRAAANAVIVRDNVFWVTCGSLTDGAIELRSTTPRSAPTITVTTTAGAVNAGTHVWSYTFYDSVTTAQSCPSRTSAIYTAPGGKGVTISGVDPLPPWANSYKLYRTLANAGPPYPGAGIAPPWLVGTYATLEGQVDANADSTIEGGTSLPSQGHNMALVCGCLISGNCIETTYYTYGILATSAVSNTFINNGCFDQSGTTVSCYRLEGGGFGNIIQHIELSGSTKPVVTFDTLVSVSHNTVVLDAMGGFAFPQVALPGLSSALESRLPFKLGGIRTIDVTCATGGEIGRLSFGMKYYPTAAAVAAVYSSDAATAWYQGVDLVFYTGRQADITDPLTAKTLVEAMRITANGYIKLSTTAMPTSDPNVAGVLWRSGTNLRISGG